MPINTSRRPKLPPGPKGGLLLGNTFAYLRDQLGFLTAAVRGIRRYRQASAG